MDAESFEFNSDIVAMASEAQRRFLEGVRGSVESLQPAELDHANTSVTLTDGTLVVELRHRSDPEQSIVATIVSDEAVVSYGVEHQHFRPEDGDSGHIWPVAAPDFVMAAVRFVELLLLGRIELEVRRGWLSLRTKSYRISDSGGRELFLTGGTILPGKRRRESETLRFDFGVTAPPDEI